MPGRRLRFPLSLTARKALGERIAPPVDKRVAPADVRALRLEAEALLSVTTCR
jgi:hypothetical protein